jgi:hypothetical protein
MRRPISVDTLVFTLVLFTAVMGLLADMLRDWLVW